MLLQMVYSGHKLIHNSVIQLCKNQAFPARCFNDESFLLCLVLVLQHLDQVIRRYNDVFEVIENAVWSQGTI